MDVSLFPETELRPGEMREVRVNGISLVVLRRHDGGWRALFNRCPHQGAPLCEGKLERLVIGNRSGDYRESEDVEVVLCPWHGFEFDVDTGVGPAEPRRLRVRSYPVYVENGTVMLKMRDRGARAAAGARTSAV